MNKTEEDDGNSMGDENMFEVEKILAMKEEFGMRRYLIKWKNYDDSENSWEPEDNLSCPELLEQFKATVNKQPPPPTLRVKLGSLNSISNSPSSLTPSSSKTVLPQKRSLSENKQSHNSYSKPDQIREEESSTPSQVTGSPTQKMSTEKFKSKSSTILRIQNERLRQHTHRRETTSSSSISPSPSPPTTTKPSSPSISASALSSSLALPSSKPFSINSTTKPKSIPLAISRLRDPRLARQRQTTTTTTASSTTTTRPITSRPLPPQPTPTTSTISTPTTHNYSVDPNNDSKPISWRGNIIGNIEPSADIQMISVPAKCPRSAIVNDFLQSSERFNGGHKILRLTAFIKLKVLERFFNAARVCLLDLNHAGSNQIGYGKLARFLMVNEVAGLVHLNDRPTDVLAIVHCTDKLASGWKLGFRSNKTLLGIFLEDMPKYPQFPRSTIELKDWPLLKSSSIKTYDWQLLLTSLQFPPHFIKAIHQETHMEIFGTSLWANMLQNAHNVYKTTVKRVYSRLLLFDRSDDSIFKTNLYKYKRSNWNTTFWQFGLSNLSLAIIPSPTESFPRNSGGYITTDAENIIHNPEILYEIANTVDTLNRHPLTLSKWRFVLKDDILTQLKTRTKGVKEAQKIQAAIVNLSILLSQDKCEIMRNWMIDNTKYPNESTATVKWAEKIVRRYHEEHEYFVLVDDIGTMKSHSGCLDRSSSRDLLNLFSVPSPTD